MMRSAAVMFLFGLLGTVFAGPGAPGFSPVENGFSSFDTGMLRGKMRLDGKQQGISQMTYTPTGMELLKSVGLLSYYRVFSSGKRYGNAAREWPLHAEVLPDGGLKITFAPADEHPFELVGIFHWRGPDTLDVETEVTPRVAMPQMEIFLSSYLTDGFDGLVYLKPNRFDKNGKPTFVRSDWNELIDGNYLVFPRDRDVLPMIYDGRWEIPPSPVTWAFTKYFEAPIGMRRHKASGLTAVLMSSPEDCFAVSVPYNREPPDNVAGHGSVYMSLFGVGVDAGQRVSAHCRLIIAKDLTDAEVLRRYGEYLAERKR